MSDEDVQATETQNEEAARPPSILKDGFWAWLVWRVTQKGKVVCD
jgi:hypothetical protein